MLTIHNSLQKKNAFWHIFLYKRMAQITNTDIGGKILAILSLKRKQDGVTPHVTQR